MIILYHTIPYYTILYINSTESEATRTQSKREGRTMDFSHSDIAIEPLQTMQDMSKLEKVCFFNPTFRYVLFVTNMVSVFFYDLLSCKSGTLRWNSDTRLGQLNY